MALIADALSMPSRLSYWAEQVTREMQVSSLRAFEAGGGKDDAHAAARAVLEREVRVFVTELCGNRDAFLDAESTPPCSAWCGDTNSFPLAPAIVQHGCRWCSQECAVAARPINPLSKP